MVDARVQQAVRRLQERVEAASEELERKVFRPEQKKSLLCSAKCCDTATSSQALQECFADCQRSLQQREYGAKVLLNDFQVHARASCERESRRHDPRRSTLVAMRRSRPGDSERQLTRQASLLAMHRTQQRYQRCTQRCQDKAQEANGRNVEGVYGGCIIDCCAEYEKQIGPLNKKILQGP